MGRFLELFRPCARANSIYDINLAELKSSGYDCIMLDLDNTLLPWKDCRISDECIAWIEEARGLGFKLSIVSNTHNPKRLQQIAEKLDVFAIDRALKPRGAGFKRAVEAACTESSRAVVVGDQLLTDIFGGNLFGAYTILVTPIHHREFIGTKVSRLVEKVIFALLRRNENPGTKSELKKSHNKDTK